MKKYLVLFTLAFVVFACTRNDDSSTDESNDSFDRQAMLVNWADNIIIPSYQSFVTKTGALNTEVSSFTANPTETTLNNLKATYKEAYLSFQNVSMFEIGLAEQIRFRDRMNTYPLNAAEVEGLIAEGTYNFELPSTNDAQGFPALDYLLYGFGNTTETLQVFTTNDNAQGYKNYLTEVVTSINTLANNVLTNWTQQYRDSFIANDGSSASASVDKLTNDFIFYYEKSLRAGKIGIPAGVFSNDPLPGNVEAFYERDFSKLLATEALQASVRFFNGRSFTNGQAGPGYATYLDSLNAIKNEADLNDLINEQFTTAQNKLNTIDDDFVNQIQTNNGAMLETYDELQRNVILLKVDMLQALNVNIDYVDADGD